jgi:hypothetical protein
MIVHPLVGQAVELLVRRSSQTVIVVEATSCWVELRTIAIISSHRPRIAEPLIQKRGWRSCRAKRIVGSASPDEKISAVVIIQNDLHLRYPQLSPPGTGSSTI